MGYEPLRRLALLQAFNEHSDGFLDGPKVQTAVVWDMGLVGTLACAGRPWGHWFGHLIKKTTTEVQEALRIWNDRGFQSRTAWLLYLIKKPLMSLGRCVRLEKKISMSPGLELDIIAVGCSFFKIGIKHIAGNYKEQRLITRHAGLVSVSSLVLRATRQEGCSCI